MNHDLAIKMINTHLNPQDSKNKRGKATISISPERALNSTQNVFEPPQKPKVSPMAKLSQANTKNPNQQRIPPPPSSQIEGLPESKGIENNSIIAQT